MGMSNDVKVTSTLDKTDSTCAFHSIHHSGAFSMGLKFFSMYLLKSRKSHSTPFLSFWIDCQSTPAPSMCHIGKNNHTITGTLHFAMYCIPSAQNISTIHQYCVMEASWENCMKLSNFLYHWGTLRHPKTHIHGHCKKWTSTINIMATAIIVLSSILEVSLNMTSCSLPILHVLLLLPCNHIPKALQTCGNKKVFKIGKLIE